MPDFTIDPFLLVRAPAYSYENFNLSFLQQVLKTDFFKASIFFASQTLYIELKKKDFDYDQFSPQAKITLWKYLNRMCFRSLPYGSFSSFSAAGWASEKEEEGLCFGSVNELTVHLDYKILFNYINGLNAEEFHSIKYYTNNSLYHTSSHLRFISQAYSAQNKFAIVELKLVPGLNKLLKFISKGQTLRSILDFLRGEYGDDAPVHDYFKSLQQGQVIISDLTPSVTGTHYNERCKLLLNDYAEVDHHLLKSFTSVFGNHDEPLPELNDHINQLTDRNIENSTYTLYQRDISGGAKKTIQTELISLLMSMDRLIGDQELETMNRFKTEFLQKYDQQEMPLMVVLDPGCGIGYENLAAAFDDQSDFIDDLRNKEERQNHASWGPVEKMLFKKWNTIHQPGSGTITITAKDLEALPKNNQHLPPGMFMLFRNIDEEIWLDNIGGVSGIELSGRFGAHQTAIEASLKKICEQEMAVNNEFLFAEIAYSPNDRSSNINQRGHFYPYEIPVLTHATRDEKNTIKLSDLVISIRNNTILLRSVSLNKYIIPRLSSAYNYRISTIPIFRFLCDLQFQGVKSNLSFSLTSLFPGMEYYPRVKLGNTVLSPATWILNENQVKAIVEEDKFPEEELNIPEHFSLHEGDNFLVFNKKNAGDLEIFKKSIKGKKTATLMEYVYAKNTDLKDAEGRAFASQLLACAVNRSKSYVLPQNQVMKADKALLKVKRSFLPVQEWVYIKIYTHYSLTNEILIDFVIPIVKKYKKDNPGFKWFFIRYEDQGHHLRLRFFTAGKPGHSLLTDLIQKLQPWSREGKIADVILDTYQRELEKYSTILINEVESFFYRDSEFILSAFMRNELTPSFKLSFAVHTTLKLIHHFISDKKDRADFISDILNNLSLEFSRDKEVVRKLDVRYRNFQKELISHTLACTVDKEDKAAVIYYQLLHELTVKTADWRHTDRYNLLINLVHMHVNRIFEHNPREYECLIYHFMKKHQSYLSYTATDVS